MSYSIRYGTFKYDTPKRKGRKSRNRIIAFCVAGAVVFALLFPQSNKKVRQVLFPYFEEHVQDAFSDMIGDIKDGTSFSDATAAFVKEIISDASV